MADLISDLLRYSQILRSSLPECVATANVTNQITVDAWRRLIVADLHVVVENGRHDQDVAISRLGGRAVGHTKCILQNLGSVLNQAAGVAVMFWSGQEAGAWGFLKLDAVQNSHAGSKTWL